MCRHKRERNRIKKICHTPDNDCPDSFVPLKKIWWQPQTYTTFFIIELENFITETLKNWTLSLRTYQADFDFILTSLCSMYHGSHDRSLWWDEDAGDGSKWRGHPHPRTPSYPYKHPNTGHEHRTYDNKHYNRTSTRTNKKNRKCNIKAKIPGSKPTTKIPYKLRTKEVPHPPCGEVSDMFPDTSPSESKIL